MSNGRMPAPGKEKTSSTAQNQITAIDTIDYLDALLAAPFPTFTFSVVGASIYQFGNFGTAMKKLHSFELSRRLGEAPQVA